MTRTGEKDSLTGLRTHTSVSAETDTMTFYFCD